MMSPLTSIPSQDILRTPVKPSGITLGGSEPGGGFGTTISSMINDAIGNVKAGEATAIAGLQGKMPLQQVVAAVMQAEQSLHTAVVVRDKVIGAYLEITRMQM